MSRQPIDLTLRLYTAPTDEVLTSLNNKKNQEVLQLFKSKEEEDARREEEEAARRVANRLRSFRYYTPEEEAEEERNGVSTRLKLYEDPWKIEKVLEYSDVKHLCCRLTISKRMVHQHIVQVWIKNGRKDDAWNLENNREVKVKVWDCDRSREYELSLKKLGSSDCYAFCQNWDQQFVVERGLKRGDKIGMFWCVCSNSFFFMLLDRSCC